jgi:hypothetical protein
MSLVDEVGGGLDCFSQLRARMASGRKPGIPVALDFEIVEGEAGTAVFCWLDVPTSQQPQAATN